MKVGLPTEGIFHAKEQKEEENEGEGKETDNWSIPPAKKQPTQTKDENARFSVKNSLQKGARLIKKAKSECRNQLGDRRKCRSRKKKY